MLFLSLENRNVSKNVQVEHATVGLVRFLSDVSVVWLVIYIIWSLKKRVCIWRIKDKNLGIVLVGFLLKTAYMIRHKEFISFHFLLPN